MKIVALEGHFATLEVMDAWKSVDPAWRDLALKATTEGEGARRLLDFGARAPIRPGAGIGWHYETGMQILRLIFLSGVFDRFPNLQIITGHWGEVVVRWC
jgi:hypothetical protein